MNLKHFSISQQGESHIATGMNCQDHSGSVGIFNEKLKIEMAIAVIADGVGSCDFSEDGSRIAVTTVLGMLSKELSALDEISAETVLRIIKRAYLQANDNIEHEAEERELPFLLFDTTLTVTVLTDNGSCYIGHIGDDGVVALFEDGTYGMITQRIEGEEANSVIPLSSVANWMFGVVKKPVAALALMTDGLLDKSVGSDRMNHRVYYPFFKPMFENIMETEQDVADLRLYWDEYLRDDAFRKGYGVTDDITLAVVQLTSLLKDVTPIPFDEEKWNRETREAKEEIEKRLEESASYMNRRTETTKEGKVTSDSHDDESSVGDANANEAEVDHEEEVSPEQTTVGTEGCESESEVTTEQQTNLLASPPQNDVSTDHQVSQEETEGIDRKKNSEIKM